MYVKFNMRCDRTVKLKRYDVWYDSSKNVHVVVMFE